jgi:Cu-Zn family superoxide dismutase
MKALPFGVAAAGMALAACAANEPAGEVLAVAAGPAAAAADIRDPSGMILARSTASQIGDSIRVRVEAMGMRAGAYGAHVHTTGRCDAPDFASAGPHWNPSGKQHGKNNPGGMHKGDLPNLAVGTDGRGSFEVTIPGALLAAGPNPLLDADGAAVVIHAAADDYRTDPSGNSGGRIACGALAS